MHLKILEKKVVGTSDDNLDYPSVSLNKSISITIFQTVLLILNFYTIEQATESLIVYVQKKRRKFFVITNSNPIKIIAYWWISLKHNRRC